MRDLISPWGPHLKRFYEYKKLCGYKYNAEESTIFCFDRYYHNLNIEELQFTRDIVEPFLFLKEGDNVITQCHKASVLREFGRYLFDNDVIDNIYTIPPISLKGEEEFIPHIYSLEELINIIEYFENLKNNYIRTRKQPNINTHNCMCALFKVLITTGMRLGEVTGLKRNSVDLDNQIFIIKEAKNNNERLVPFSDSLKKALTDYIDDTPYTINSEDYFFSTRPDSPKLYVTVKYYFYKCLKDLKIQKEGRKGPRLHDFRHTCSVMILTKLQRENDNVNINLSYLSAYLGHKSVKETQRYIWLTPGLFEDTKNKMQEYSSFIARIFEGENYYD